MTKYFFEKSVIVEVEKLARNVAAQYTLDLKLQYKEIQCTSKKPFSQCMLKWKSLFIKAYANSLRVYGGPATEEKSQGQWSFC